LEDRVLMAKTVANPEEKYENLVALLKKEPGVSQPTDRKGFGSSAIWTSGKMFAFLSSRGKLVVKLPKNRVDELIELELGEKCETVPGRPMKQWLVVNGTEWLPLAKEAMNFVRSEAAKR
jgi:hypothetical protein